MAEPTIIDNSSGVFPSVVWGKWSVNFELYEPRQDVHSACYASLVFVFVGDQLAIAQIPGRGWSVAGGRLEAGETALQAASREAYEELGAIVDALTPVGWYTLSALDAAESSDVQMVPVFVAGCREFDPIPAGSESLGMKLVRLEDLPAVYYTWDPLIESVCKYMFQRFVG